MTFTTFAGLEGGAGFYDGTGSAARFYYPMSVATDSSGNVYVADTFNCTIRKITTAGEVTTLAGLAGQAGSADGRGSAARFGRTEAVATDGSGNVYVADPKNQAIRRIAPTGAVTTLPLFARGRGRAASVWYASRFDPRGVTIDGSGNVYVADYSNHVIRKITAAGSLTTLGISGSPGNADGTGSLVRFAAPEGLAADKSGNVYVAQGNGTIRKISPTGVVTTLAGLANTLGSADGTGSAARFYAPRGIATDSSGNVYVADVLNHTIRRITPAGVVTTLAGVAGSYGSADGNGDAARFYLPSGVATDSSGNVFVADSWNHTIRKISPAGEVTTLGRASSRGNADGMGSAARFDFPSKAAADSGGNVYVADSKTIRKITPAGEVTTLAGFAGSSGGTDGTGSAARFIDPHGVAIDSSGNVYVADRFGQTIRKITPAGEVTTLAGHTRDSGITDGTGSAARFTDPVGVAIDAAGNVYVADSNSHTIRKITPAGVVTTLAGLARTSGSADGTGSAARFFAPQGVATDRSGNVYVADYLNQTIRKIAPAGEVTTLAGLAGVSGSADGTGSAARFHNPTDVATDSGGNVYVADFNNHTIRKITPEGIVTTLGGLAGTIGCADGTGSVARFNYALGVATDGSGNLFVADLFNYTIRIGRPALADVATVDTSTGQSGSTRLLGTAPQTATSWQWSVIRRPAGSTAILSSESVQNPTFTPDVAGLFTFRLIATGAAASSITTVDLAVDQ